MVLMTNEAICVLTNTKVQLLLF